ncbi:hypothetical protein K437DRAFT_188357 [Tilletiaria anomala UBC 951]|uniref:RlpA-like protein double-psi beta-barrel domain-containing protein n=1 Tax=Tilletiaria anomala (strain ATCC 24038 / CBS 436.72 / UBC 951) TaxID=1037660 RepID=A0A066VGB6_TILAU|nr:uncharacterized protein K437DRAFT_188357 [Tilletiaria anomala UBC 951]KDN40526.1 hypothetical protein K437DRAFT_188357 [Tilletiaria anomala UBC 951]
MARLTLLAFLLAAALAVMSGMAENSTILNEVLDHAPGANDDDGNLIRFINGGADPDDDDIEDEGLARRRFHARHAKKHKSKKVGVHKYQPGKKLWVRDCQITWYASNDLKNPQCGNGKWNPHNGNHIGAVMAGWDGGPKCGEFIDLCRGNACVSVRIVDKCAGCGKNHVDLTKSAFKRLSPSGTLKEGRIHGLKMFHNSKPNPWNLQLFGPYNLKG